MRRLLKPYNLLLYLLAILAFFFFGLIYASLIDAGKDQGLAAGAIVLGYGVMGAFFAFIVSLFAASRLSRAMVIRLNQVLALAIVLCLAYIIWNYNVNVKPKRDQQKKEVPTKPVPTTPVGQISTAGFLSIPMAEESPGQGTQGILGLGIFSPRLFDVEALHLYNNLNYEKTIDEHLPSDSITFQRNEFGSFEITYAPPYLMPEHMKLDYDILKFQVVAVLDDFIEIVVNSRTRQTSFVSRESGILEYWPDFLLGVSSVELIDRISQQVHVKPIQNASIVKSTYSFMRPLLIQQDWMKILLLDEDFQSKGEGWIKWKSEKELLVSYSLLS